MAEVKSPQRQDEDSPLGDQEELLASASFMITQQQKAALRERGYTDEQIQEMKPEDAHRALGLIN